MARDILFKKKKIVGKVFTNITHYDEWQFYWQYKWYYFDIEREQITQSRVPYLDDDEEELTYKDAPREYRVFVTAPTWEYCCEARKDFSSIDEAIQYWITLSML